MKRVASWRYTKIKRASSELSHEEQGWHRGYNPKTINCLDAIVPENYQILFLAFPRIVTYSF